MAIEAYASAASVAPGETIGFCASNDAAGIVTVAIFEVGSKAKTPILVRSAPAGWHVTPERAYELGCAWPVFCEFTVPNDWPSGLYRALLSDTASPPSTTNVFFVVRSVVPGNDSKVQRQSHTPNSRAAGVIAHRRVCRVFTTSFFHRSGSGIRPSHIKCVSRFANGAQYTR
jgi:hypothetical protein